MSDATLVPLNRTEHMFWAGEGFIGSINQPYLMRFDGPVDEALVRLALRELVSAYPRLRGVIVPTTWSYKLQILPDDGHIDTLFEDCFRVVHDVDGSSLEALRTFNNAFQNDAISMERGLPLRMRFIPHPTSPALVMSLHHIIGDGRSLLQMVGAIVARLNGTPIKSVPLHSHSMVPAVVPQKWTQWPASILGWWRNTRRDAAASKGLNLVTLARRQSARFSTASLHYRELQCSAKALRVAAKGMGTTVNSLMTAVIANTFLALAKDDPKAMSAIRISYDLRKLFPEGTQPEIGNFVSSFAVKATHQATLGDQIQSIEAQVKDVLSRYERREYALPLLLYEALPIMGRRLYALMIAKAKAGGKLQDVSCHFSNLGGADFLNPKDAATVRLKEIWLSALPVVTIFGVASMGEKMYFTALHQDDETDRQDVTAFLDALDRELLSLTASGS